MVGAEPADIGRAAGYTLNKSPVHLRANMNIPGWICMQYICTVLLIFHDLVNHPILSLFFFQKWGTNIDNILSLAMFTTVQLKITQGLIGYENVFCFFFSHKKMLLWDLLWQLSVTLNSTSILMNPNRVKVYSYLENSWSKNGGSCSAWHCQGRLLLTLVGFVWLPRSDHVCCLDYSDWSQVKWAKTSVSWYSVLMFAC